MPSVPCQHYQPQAGCQHPHPGIVKSLTGHTICVVEWYYQNPPSDPRIMPPQCQLMKNNLADEA